MADVVDVDRPIAKWGNAYGLHVSVDELRKLRVQPGERVRMRLQSQRASNHLDEVEFLQLGLPSKKEDVEGLLAEDIQADLARDEK